MIKQTIKEYLTTYSDYPLLSKTIAEFVNHKLGMAITDLEIRKYVKELRQEGNLIIAGHNGYCLTTDLGKIQKYLSARWGELTREMKVLKTMAQACNMIDQLTLWEGNNNEH